MSKALWKGSDCEKLKSTCDNLGAVYSSDVDGKQLHVEPLPEDLQYRGFTFVQGAVPDVPIGMGGGTFFTVGGYKCTSKNYRTFLWFELASVTSQASKYDVITYALYEGLNYYFRQNYTTMKTHRWNTWNSNRLL